MRRIGAAVPKTRERQSPEKRRRLRQMECTDSFLCDVRESVTSYYDCNVLAGFPLSMVWTFSSTAALKTERPCAAIEKSFPGYACAQSSGESASTAWSAACAFVSAAVVFPVS